MVPDHSLRPAPEEQVQLVQCDTPTASSRLLYARRRALAPASNTSNCSGDTAESTASSTDHLPPITYHCIKKSRATYCARNDPLPLLPSGPGGVGGITSRRTRHTPSLPFSSPFVCHSAAQRRNLLMPLSVLAIILSGVTQRSHRESLGRRTHVFCRCLLLSS